jgi:hypothetical protein
LTLYEFSNKGDLVAVSSGSVNIFGLIFDSGVNPSTGILSGTPTSPTNKSLVVLAVCGTGATSTYLKAEITLLLAGAPSITPLDQTVSGEPGSAITPTPIYTQSNFESCAPTPVSFDTDRLLPGGLSIDSGTGSISGTPAAEVSTEVTVRAYCGANYDSATTKTTARVQFEIGVVFFG